jgi:hypothetical protein
VRTVEQIVEQMRAAAGADFAFVLTRKGRLVTYRAPRDMPEVGRNRLVRAAKPLVGTEQVAELTIPREEIVPYGGAAPVDVFLGVAAEQAIVCLVMATWADKIRVIPALTSGLEAIEPLLKRGVTAGRKVGDLAPAKGSPFFGDRRSTMPPPMGGVMAFVAPAPAPLPADRPKVPGFVGRLASLASLPGAPRPDSTPDIHVGEAELGRMSMAAIQHATAGSDSSPEITIGDAELGRMSMAAVSHELIGTSSSPEIVVTGEAALGRESLAAIDLDGKPRPASSPEAIRVELVSLPEVVLEGAGRASMPGRATMPWVEAPADTIRAAAAAVVGRKLSAPRVTVKLEEADEGLLDAAGAEAGVKPAPDKKPARR